MARATRSSAPAPRVAWITGGSRGIGAATATRLADDGFHLAIGYHRNGDAAETLCENLRQRGVHAFAIQADVREADEVQNAHATIAEKLGAPDTLVVSHGVYARSGSLAMDVALWRDTIEVNLTGTFHALRASLPAMKERGFGRIVVMGSILGRIGSEHGAHYAASKAGQLALVRSVAKEFSRDGVTANLIAPSMIDTDMLAGDTPEQRARRERDVPVGRVGTAEECAAAVAWLVGADADYVTGTLIPIDGGFQMG